MKPTNHPVIGEQELAAINARAEASLLYDADAWDDATDASSVDYTTLCDSVILSAFGDFD